MNQLPSRRFSPAAISALVGALVPFLFLALRQMHVHLQVPVALTIAVFPACVPGAFMTMDFIPSTPLSTKVMLFLFVVALNTAAYAWTAAIVVWFWRRLFVGTR